jgi:hypothetical protein
LVNAETQLAHDHVIGQTVVGFRVDPRGLPLRLGILDELIALAQVLEPTRTRFPLLRLVLPGMFAAGSKVDDLLLMTAEESVQIPR